MINHFKQISNQFWLGHDAMFIVVNTISGVSCGLSVESRMNSYQYCCPVSLLIELLVYTEQA